MSKRSERRERDHSRHRPLTARPVPFASLLLVALVAVPLVGTILWAIGRDDADTRGLIVWVDATAATILAGLAVLIGSQVTGRHRIVYWHVATTVYLVGAAWGLTTVISWPRWWLVVHFFGSLGLAGSWALYRLDALRSDAREAGGEDTWGDLFGIPKTKVGRAKVDDYTVRANLTTGPGETVADAQSALPRIESAASALPGRSRIVANPDNARESELVIVRNDALRTWLPWPGPSHPGGSIVDGIHTSVYEDGTAQWYWVTAGETAQGDPRPATHMGRMGMSRAGKSGDAKLELTELMTRSDVCVFYADATKGQQTAAPLMGGITLYADTAAKSRALFKAVQKLVRNRADRLGAHGFNDWSPAAYAHPQLRMPAIVYFIDEADEQIQSETFTWLCTKALSTGVFLSVTMPRADHASMPTTARFSIGAWKCFGVGDDYSAEFALTERTRKAGAHPEYWKATKPGYHYLDSAPGVDERMWAVPCRSYRHVDAQLAAAVAAAAPIRAVLPADDIAALGDAWTYCQPGNARTTVTSGNGNSAAPSGAADMEGDDMESEQVPAMADAEPGDREAYAATDPSHPIPPFGGENVDFDAGDDRPAAKSPEEAAAAFDALLVDLAAGDPQRAEVQLRELVDRYPYRSTSWLSRRLSAVADGDVVSPPGLTLERTDTAGRYVLHRLVPAGADSG